MRKLDFISEGPQLSIFQEDANKNNLGGVLYLIHIIILILLGIMYIADFIDKDKYEFNYFYIRDTFNESEIKQGINKGRENLNFDLELKFQIGKDNELIEDNPRFVIFLEEDVLETMEDNIFHANTGHFGLEVAYNCSGLPNCSIQEKIELKFAHIF